MKEIYRSDKWLDVQAKTFETKTLKKKGRSLTFTGIGRKLIEGAIIEIQTDSQSNPLLVLDLEKYKANKAAYVAKYLT